MDTTVSPLTPDRPPSHPTGFRSIPFGYPGIKLLVALGLLFVTSPFVEDLAYGNLIESLLLTVVMVAALLAVGGQRRTFHVAMVLIVPAVLAKWLTHLDLVPKVVYPATGVVFFGYVVAQLLRYILNVSRVDTNVLCAGLSGYILLGLLWIPLYEMVAKLNPASFAFPAGSESAAPLDGFNAFYFSFMTLCTVGYGDITPMSRPARMLAVTEAVAGLFYVAVLISRLVAVYSTTPPPAAKDSLNKP